MKMLNNMLMFGAGIGAGMMVSKHSKDIKKAMNKGKKEVSKTLNQMSNQMKSN